MTSNDLKTFNIRPFFDELRQNLLASSGRHQGVTITVEADALTVDLDFAIPLGLLVTELVSNALKHMRLRKTVAVTSGFSSVNVRTPPCFLQCPTMVMPVRPVPKPQDGVVV